MVPIIQILLAIALAMMALNGQLFVLLELDTLGVLVGTTICTAALFPIAWWCEGAVRRAWRDASEGDRATRDRAYLRHLRIVSAFRGVPLGLFAVVVLVVGWPQWIARGPLAGLVLVDEIAVLAPFGALLVLSWWLQHRLESKLARGDVSTRQFMAFQFRQLMLPVAPVAVAILLFDLVMTSPAAVSIIGAFPFLMLAMIFVVLIGIYVASGPLLRFVLSARRLEDGPLRDRLTAFATRTGFRYRQLLLWPTGMGLINAAIVGGFPPVRYVLFTEGMLEQFSDDEIEAVFAHEIGHARGGHLHLYFLFAGTLVFLWHGVLGWVGPELTDLEQYGLFAVVVIVYWRVVFGVVSRAFEREADYLGAESVGEFGVVSRAFEREADGLGAEPVGGHWTFVNALEAVAARSGTLRDQPSWRHYSIAQRSAFLARAFAEPAVARRFRSRVKWVKTAVVLTFVVAVAIAMRDAGPQYRAGRGVLDAMGAMRDDRPEAAQAAVERLMADPSLHRHAAVAAASQQPGGLDGLVAADILLRAAGPIRVSRPDTADRYHAAAAYHLGRVVSGGLARVRANDVDGAHERLVKILGYSETWSAGGDLEGLIDVLRRAIRAAQSAS